jgi:hypothetical protein
MNHSLDFKIPTLQRFELTDVPVVSMFHRIKSRQGLKVPNLGKLTRVGETCWASTRRVLKSQEGECMHLCLLPGKTIEWADTAHTYKIIQAAWTVYHSDDLGDEYQCGPDSEHICVFPDFLCEHEHIAMLRSLLRHIGGGHIREHKSLPLAVRCCHRLRATGASRWRLRARAQWPQMRMPAAGAPFASTRVRAIGPTLTST